MKWDIVHRTHYPYASPVRERHNEVHLQPLSNEQQTVDSFLPKFLPAARRPDRQRGKNSRGAEGRAVLQLHPAQPLRGYLPGSLAAAVDAIGDERDVWQQSLRLMAFVHVHLQYQSKSTLTPAKCLPSGAAFAKISHT